MARPVSPSALAPVAAVLKPITMNLPNAAESTDGVALLDQAKHSLVLDMITRIRTWSPRYGVAPGYGLQLGANDGFQEIFTASMTAAVEWGLDDYAHGVLDNYLTHFMRRRGRLLVYRGLEMAQQGRMLAVIAKYWHYTAATAATTSSSSGGNGANTRKEDAANLIVANFGKIQGAAGVLRERRAAALSVSDSVDIVCCAVLLCCVLCCTCFFSSFSLLLFPFLSFSLFILYLTKVL